MIHTLWRNIFADVVISHDVADMHDLFLGVSEGRIIPDVSAPLPRDALLLIGTKDLFASRGNSSVPL